MLCRNNDIKVHAWERACPATVFAWAGAIAGQARSHDSPHQRRGRKR